MNGRDVAAAVQLWSEPMDADDSLQGTTSERVYSAMVHDIVSGALAPGARLKFADLCARYGLSQMPIREAVQRLQGEGLVVMTPNRGARVRSIDRQFIADIYGLRAALMVIIYRDMFADWSPDLARQLSSIQRRFDAASEAGDLAGCKIENENFHKFINARCRNAEVLRVMATQDLLVATLRSAVGYSEERLRVQTRDHWAIIEAIEGQDVDAAIAAAQAHGRSSGEDVARVFEALPK
jgi:DNA-binding GntR family transcriptional regulator